jgi:hypothetical protein
MGFGNIVSVIIVLSRLSYYLDYRIISIIEEGEVIILAIMMVAHRSQSYSDKSIKELMTRSEELETLIENSQDECD